MSDKPVDEADAVSGPGDEADREETAMADALGLIATTPHLLVALDFDGTLAPEVDQPLSARALPDAQEAILRLTGLPETTVALVSGRSLDSLTIVADAPPSVLLVGSHGVEYRVHGEPEVSLTEAEIALRSRLFDVLRDVVAPYESVHLEEKPAGFAVHTRLADAETTTLVEAEARRRVAEFSTGITERVGKNVLEFSVRSVSKGDAIKRLRSLAGSTAVFFAGDDVTDEDAFGALAEGDFGLKCGPGATAARYRVDSPAGVAHVLDDLAELRAHLGRA